jgi:hypothetical protein
MYLYFVNDGIPSKGYFERFIQIMNGESIFSSSLWFIFNYDKEI